MQASDSLEQDIKEFEKVCDDIENSAIEKYADHDESCETVKNLIQEKPVEQFRVYDGKNARVAKFYRDNHVNQTLEFVLKQKQKYSVLNKMQMGILDALEYLSSFIDDSDPDTEMSQTEHALQTAEALRKSNKPDWMILVGLIHDLGKVLIIFGEPQWAVVGDTFPVGCAFSKKIVYSEYFQENPDTRDSRYNTLYGIYEPNCGLDKVHMSYGHDEYMYNVCKQYLPEPALYILRYHSFYPAHRENEYQHLMNDFDKQMMEYVKEFNPFDLYSKAHDKPNYQELKPYYSELVNKYFPSKINW